MANDFKIKNGLQLGGAFIEKVGTVSGNADLDLNTGNVFSYTPTENTTFTFSNSPASGVDYGFTLKVTGADVTVGYDLANASYDSVSFNYQSQEEQGTDIFFKPDGTVLYVMGETGDAINQYSLSTAWDISTASYVQNFSVAAQEINPRGLFFKSDGSKMFVCGIDGDDVNEYTLSTAWDISTAVFSQNFSIAAQETAPGAISFKGDGTKMFIGGAIGDSIYEYTLSTPWDVSTASYTQSFSVASQETNIGGLQFSTDGTEMFIVGTISDSVFRYSLSTAWDISTASYSSVSFSVAAQSTTPTGLFFKPDGKKMYVINVGNDTVYQYSTASTPAPATFTYPASVDWPSATPPDAPADGETDILVFSTTDGGTTWYGIKTGDAMA